jgi:hypothetical protein
MIFGERVNRELEEAKRLGEDDDCDERKKI